MFYILQATTILFAIAAAYLNQIPVEKMIYAGASINEGKKFHAANSMVKIIYSASVCLSFYPPGYRFGFFFVILSLIQWFVFDIALNVFLSKRWDYIGRTAWIDKVLNAVFGSVAGKVKAIICIAAIITLNIFFKTTIL